jgi:hypothetical protein
VRELEEDRGIPQTIVSEILTEDLGKKCVAAKFISRLLSKEQKEFCAEVVQDMLETANKDSDFPKKVITADESWVYDYDPETKVHSSQWKSPKSSCLKKAQQSQSNVKAMLMIFLIYFFYYHEGVHHKYTPPGQTITKEYYIKVLQWLRDAVRSKWPQLWASGNGSFIMTVHPPSPPLFPSAVMQAFLAKFVSPRSVSLPTAQIWLPPTFGFSQSYSGH